MVGVGFYYRRLKKEEEVDEVILIQPTKSFKAQDLMVMGDLNGPDICWGKTQQGTDYSISSWNAVENSSEGGESYWG